MGTLTVVIFLILTMYNISLYHYLKTSDHFSVIGLFGKSLDKYDAIQFWRLAFSLISIISVWVWFGLVNALITVFALIVFSKIADNFFLRKAFVREKNDFLSDKELMANLSKVEKDTKARELAWAKIEENINEKSYKTLL